MSEEVCPCCGATIPEGRIICPGCETSSIRTYNEYNKMIADGTFIEEFYGVKLKWYQKLLLKIIWGNKK